MNTPRQQHGAILLPNGRVLVFGGYGSNGIYVASAELYDPATGTWTNTGPLSAPRISMAACLMSNGKVLAAGGFNGNIVGATNAVDIYDPGLAFKASWQPQLATFTSPLPSGGILSVTGTGFRGLSDGSGGNLTQDSASDHPVVQLRSLDGAMTFFPFSTNWSTNFLVSVPVGAVPVGPALLTVFVNGIPSASSMVFIDLPAILLSHPQRLLGGAFQFSFTNMPGADFTVLASTNLALPLGSWTTLGPPSEISSGYFQFVDLEAPNYPRRFYRVNAP
jgi:hypothetical protein